MADYTPRRQVSSVPDPYVFEPPESESVIICMDPVPVPYINKQKIKINHDCAADFASSTCQREKV